MERLTTGQMAKLNGVSVRTIRMYHGMGLLVPRYVDEQTSYRYYSPAQSARLSMIVNMKRAGLSLAEIKNILDERELPALEAALLRQLADTDASINELQLKKASLHKMLETCCNFINPPTLNNIFVEYRPPLRVFGFDTEPFDLEDKSDTGGTRWKKIIAQVRRTMRESGMPEMYLGGIGCVVRRDNLLSGKLICDGAFLMPYEGMTNSSVPVYEMPAGTCVSIFDCRSSGDGASEAAGIKKLVAFIKEMNLTINGNYTGEVTAESSVFDAESSMSLVKMQIPVRASNAQVEEGGPKSRRDFM